MLVARSMIARVVGQKALLPMTLSSLWVVDEIWTMMVQAIQVAGPCRQLTELMRMATAFQTRTLGMGSTMTATVWPPTGYVLTFSNRLAVYLSGDTGVTAEQDTVVRQHYNAKLVVMNIGDTYTTGPADSAWVINNLVNPAAAIASHANQPSTRGGKAIEGTRTDAFIKASKVPVHVPLSGRTMSFDSGGNCTDGC